MSREQARAEHRLPLVVVPMQLHPALHLHSFTVLEVEAVIQSAMPFWTRQAFYQHSVYIMRNVYRGSHRQMGLNASYTKGWDLAYTAAEAGSKFPANMGLRTCTGAGVVFWPGPE